MLKSNESNEPNETCSIKCNLITLGKMLQLVKSALWEKRVWGFNLQNPTFMEKIA